MRLADFILGNVELILAEWEAFARSLESGATMTKLALRDDAEAILLATVQDMQTGQSPTQQSNKSKGNGGAVGEESERLDHASALHGVQRVGSGFDIVEVVAEYRSLRASVLRLWHRRHPQLDVNDMDDLIRFNESIDQSLAVAVGSYTSRVEQSRRLFLGILGHDLRDPLNRISMAAQLASRSANDPGAAKALSMIKTNTETITRLISDLIDFASTGLGRAMPLTCGPVDLEKLCRNIFEEFCFAYPQRTLRFHPGGDLTGDWDAARLQQVVSNLMSNALQHGSPEGPVDLSIASDGSTVILSVHNEGPPIPPEKLGTIFDPLMRHAMPEESATRQVSGSIGLGLYIVRAIVVAHGGTVEVTSTTQAGTTFNVCLPRSQPARSS
jgi:signal transduction histidine kinase